MKQDAYNRFIELREEYYLAGRCLLINQLFDMAAINFGYAIELSFKFLLSFKGHPQKELMRHNLINLYSKTLKNDYISPLSVSSDFMKFADERLNTRYPAMISGNIKDHEEAHKAYVFTIDMLHCYDDLILQLDDAIYQCTNDIGVSIGYRATKQLESHIGRVFYHCNDHAFQRIDGYSELLKQNMESIEEYNKLKSILSNRESLWNFKGLISYRPWGPKQNWNPANEYEAPKFNDNIASLIAAKWNSNNTESGIYLSSMKFVLPKGKYKFQSDELIIKNNN